MNSDNSQQMDGMELGHLYEKLHTALHYQRVEEAEKAVRELLEVAPRSTTSWELWGDVLLAQGKLEEASGWSVLVGPRESSGIPAYLRTSWQEQAA